MKKPASLLDSAELLQALVSADLAYVEAPVGVDPATVRAELELPWFGAFFTPGAEFLAFLGPDLNSAPADDVENPLSVYGHIARPVHPVDLRKVAAIHVKGLPAEILSIHNVDESSRRKVDVMWQVKPARLACRYASHLLAAKGRNKDRVPASPGKDEL